MCSESLYLRRSAGGILSRTASTAFVLAALTALTVVSLGSFRASADDQIEVAPGSSVVIDKIEFSDQGSYANLKWTLIPGSKAGGVQNYTLKNFSIPPAIGAFGAGFSFSFDPPADPAGIGPAATDVEITIDSNGHLVSEPIPLRMLFFSGESTATADFEIFLTTDDSGAEAGHAPLPFFCDLNPLEFDPAPHPIDGSDEFVVAAAGCAVTQGSLESFGLQLKIYGTLLEGVTAAVCSNGEDDDGDGVADFPLDPGCGSADDSTETSPLLDCDDGIDNDGDGKIDFAEDDGCVSIEDPTETKVCGDGFVDQGEECDDGNASSGDCCSSSCQYESNGSSCTDGNICTVSDSCNGVGRCLPGSDLNCDNSLFCDGVESCSPFSGCQSGTPPLVSDGIACTADSCNESTNRVDHTPNHGFCDNDQFCDGVESCSAVSGCVDGPDPDPSDGVDCTVDFCNASTEEFEHVPNDFFCPDDGLFCNGSPTCDVLLDCVADPVLIDDGVSCTADSCDEVNDTVIHTPVHSSCDDAQFCNGAEVCDLGLGCQNGVAPNIDDGVACTQDSCDETNDVIVNDPDDSACDDSDACTTDSCDASLGCQEVQIPLCGLPDLVIDEVVGPTSANVGALVDASGVVADLGLGSPDSLQVSVAFFMSDDEVIGDDDMLGSCEISSVPGGGQDGCDAMAMEVPPLVDPGTQQLFFWGACADDGDGVAEADENNNCALGNSVMVPEPASATLHLAALFSLLLLAQRSAPGFRRLAVRATQSR